MSKNKGLILFLKNSIGFVFGMCNGVFFFYIYVFFEKDKPCTSKLKVN